MAQYMRRVLGWILAHQMARHGRKCCNFFKKKFNYFLCSCIANPDVINVHDGENSSAPLIGQVCGQSSYLEFVSSSGTMLAQFVAKSDSSAKGFKAEYTFVPKLTGGPTASQFAFGVHSTAMYHNYALFGEWRGNKKNFLLSLSLLSPFVEAVNQRG